MTTMRTSFLDNLRYPVRQFNKWILNPAMLAFAGRRLSPYAAVRHVGRRTGREYATPVVAAATEEQLALVENIARASERLQDIVGELNRSVTSFKL